VKDSEPRGWHTLVVRGVLACAFVLLAACSNDSEESSHSGAAHDAAAPPHAAAQAKGTPRGFRYSAQDEYEVEKPLSKLDEIDQWTLKLRAKQPIDFLGVPMRQIPSDNWLMSELLWRVKPDYMIEAGTLYGGSALYYAAMLEWINPDAKVLTIDIDEKQLDAGAKNNPLWARRVVFYKGSSVSPEIHERLAAEIGKGKKVFVTLDTLHAPKHVASELELFSRYVSPGSYMVLQDTYYEGLTEVVDEFLKTHVDWHRDTKADERFVFSKYRGGFLQRKK
jgi:cephalosporin hydroxylase